MFLCLAVCISPPLCDVVDVRKGSVTDECVCRCYLGDWEGRDWYERTLRTATETLNTQRHMGMGFGYGHTLIGLCSFFDRSLAEDDWA